MRIEFLNYFTIFYIIKFTCGYSFLMGRVNLNKKNKSEKDATFKKKKVLGRLQRLKFQHSLNSKTSRRNHKVQTCNRCKILLLFAIQTMIKKFVTLLFLSSAFFHALQIFFYKKLAKS